MMTMTRIFMLVFLIGVKEVKSASKSSSTSWSYDDSLGNGPSFWSDSYPDCAGMNQSPIDIVMSQTVRGNNLGPIKLVQELTPGETFKVKNNGHTIEVEVDSGVFVSGGGLPNAYKVRQFHFHWGNTNQKGSEHSLDGAFFPLEMHIVSWNYEKYASVTEALTQTDGLAVLGILFEISNGDNNVLSDLINAIPGIADPDLEQNTTIPAIFLEDLLPVANVKYFRYRGSLTTPGCFEVVTWTVFERPQKISQEQLDVFRQALTSAHEGVPKGNHYVERTALVDSFRPIQNLNGRTVFRSKGMP